MHYYRNRRHGCPLKVRAKVESSVRADGYVLLYRSHPLASRAGVVYEHRAVLFDRIGSAPQKCHWCPKIVRWDRTHPVHDDALIVDHLDDDKANNSPANLVPSCHVCNVRRGNSKECYDEQYGPIED